MAQSLAQIHIHLVFSIKGRQRFFLDENINERLRGYVGGILRDLECPSIAIGTPEDHVHILFCLSRTMSLADVVGKVKSASSKWIHELDGDYRAFAWQGGYGAFSVSASAVPDVESYIANQAEHHRRMSFQDEFRLLLEKYNLKYDEAYVWD